MIFLDNRQKARAILYIIIVIFLLEANHMVCTMYDNGPEWFQGWNWIDVQFTLAGQLFVWQVQILNCIIIFWMAMIICLLGLVVLEGSSKTKIVEKG